MSENKKKSTVTKHKLADFLASDLFIGADKDLLPVILDPEKEYSLVAVKSLLRKEKERNVNV